MQVEIRDAKGSVSIYHVETREAIMADGMPGLTWTVSCGHRSYEIAKVDDPAESLSCGPNKGLACECQDFLHRHKGTGSYGCKHIIALTSRGIIPSVQVDLQRMACN